MRTVAKMANNGHSVPANQCDITFTAVVYEVVHCGPTLHGLSAQWPPANFLFTAPLSCITTPLALNLRDKGVCAPSAF